MTAQVHDPIDPAVRREIETRLDAVEATQGVRLLMAIESGSRAWGFPSPDSDYDVRFVYVRPRDWYLSLAPGRDVIEHPIVDEIDLNGWDVRKTLGLLLRSNAVVSEWMLSPIRYRADDPFIGKLAALADDLLDPRALALHYANLGRAASNRWLDRPGDVPVKKYFYALRPALAVRALRLRPDARPPMNLQALVEVTELPAALVEQIALLVAAKSRTNELSNGTRVPEIDALIGDELGRAAELPATPMRADAEARASELFVELVNS
ncbi:nucleotidyltransferase domain-containing protein [Sphingomonas sp. R-74633]|uniref:nucleotidyltransferase domain-containing protein n=1 Tax=Sphingomonas sp. R-74633 TaxID=2751188 RepID=UPI0015D30279|nr:nucleotidyltransferase domain-containing protein [Sphingomonas sp. R-74633]NYT42274.1 nucleotidyltransferase domain-containing protein [Sphingomonas sp. R-74633]